MYDLLLINTHRQRDFDGGGYADWLGVRLLASYIEDCGYSARVFSGFTHECVEILREELPRGVKVVGFACDYDNWREVMNLAKMIKEEYGVPVIVGGHQAIALDKDFLEKSGVLAIVRGEGEIPLHGLMQYLIDGAGSLADIPGLTYLEDGAEKRTPSPPPIENLDALPFIDPSLCLDSHFRDRYATVITARGCPFQCAFCYEGGNTRRVRWRSVDNVMAELKEMLASTPELRFALFVDDTFTLNKKRIAEFCDKLRVYREERDFCWFAEAHASTILKHPEIIPMMVDAGLASLQIGVESGSERVLRGYNKKTTPQMLKEAVAICKEASVVHVPANIIVGGAFETRETIEESRRFGLELLEIGAGMLELRPIFFWPLPNTAMTNNPQNYGMEILDLCSYTSMYDYPVARCGDLEPLELSSLRESMGRAFQEKMNEIASVLPRSQVKRLLKYHIYYGVVTGYSSYFMNIPRFRRYGMLRNKGAVSELPEIPPLELPDWYPQRLCSPLYKNGVYYADDVSLTEDEYAVLLSAAGKLSVREGAAHCGFSLEKYIDILTDLENKTVVSFAKY